MSLATLKSRHEALLSLPPLSFFPTRYRRWLLGRSIVRLHLGTIALLYSLLIGAATLERTLLIVNGIGILQNEPFLIHFLFGLFSIPLVLLVIARLLALASTNEGSDVIASLIAFVRQSKTKNFTFGVAFLMGAFAFAYTIVLSSSPTLDIYDSVRHPLTFSAYLIIRLYLFLFCYPLVFSGVASLVFALFQSLRRSTIPYRPFHHDGMGGFQVYFVAVDRPVYALQTIAVLIALMNYIAWGGMEFVPIILSTAAPIVVTVFAALLFVHFNNVLSLKKRKEIERIHEQQMRLYADVRQMASEPDVDHSDVIKRIESMERLLDMVCRVKRRGWKKYAVNVAALIAPQVIKLAGVPAAKVLFGQP